MSLIWNARTYYLSLATHSLAYHTSTKLTWTLTLSLTGTHHHCLCHCHTAHPGGPRAQRIWQSKITLILPRMAKWSVSKVFSALHLNLTCGKLFPFSCSYKKLFSAISYNPKNIFLLYSPSNSESSDKTGAETKQAEASPFVPSSAASPSLRRRTT